jgi:hypothetical protein
MVMRFAGAAGTHRKGAGFQGKRPVVGGKLPAVTANRELLLTTRQASRVLGIGPREVRRFVALGRLVPVVVSELPGHLFRSSDVLRLAAERRRNPPRRGRPPKARAERLAA